MKKYLAFDIGCIECGEESRVIGVFDTKRKAENARAVQKANWEGQHYFRVYEIVL